ncbi:uncharacterized protein A1O9_06381 [Exophiala aquamarina CBS 119918]|uniref:Protein YAE1 n=1 Tax=Exophiala aquamarina CBS 119918 TaxID=1182545 RepID=A0A072PSF3_9EURO|nr:uncharacterized protein A1O9_06381 [Exophiala aquamarina CBS 119918]KEF58455.1 hypothetical protein A1O9_06381 [Exophiala aquamarina CBS 119918]
MAPLAHSHSHSPSRSSEHNAPSSPSTTVTTPDQSPGADDDIWDTSSDHQPPHYGSNDNNAVVDQENYPDRQGLSQRGPDLILSELPTLRRQHMTSGYREGLAIGKAQVMQRGFDEGYPFGVDLGLRIGAVLGVLEGALAALKKACAAGQGPAAAKRGRRPSSSSGKSPAVVAPTPSTTTTIAAPKPSTPRGDELRSFLTSLYARAQAELRISELMKVLDDEKVAKLEPGDPLPPAIDGVVSHWERIVLNGAFEPLSSLDDVSAAPVESKAVEQEGTTALAVQSGATSELGNLVSIKF